MLSKETLKKTGILNEVCEEMEANENCVLSASCRKEDLLSQQQETQIAFRRERGWEQEPWCMIYAEVPGTWWKTSELQRHTFFPRNPVLAHTYLQSSL